MEGVKMDSSVAYVLIANLLERVQRPKSPDGDTLAGALTEMEMSALRAAADQLRLSSGTASPDLRVETGGIEADAEKENSPPETPTVQLNLSSLQMGDRQPGMRICVDFGTAMSKAALIIDGDDPSEPAAVEVLSLGVAGEQQEFSETMLISSVYIANDGRIVFGKAAVDTSGIEHADGARTRADNIKRYLSEDGLEEAVAKNFNPTSMVVTGHDLILAYLAFFSYTISQCVADLGLQTNIERRFAMPCFPEPRSTRVRDLIREMLGQAQVLADTFQDRLLRGIPLDEFMTALHSLPVAAKEWSMIGANLTEPLGVANVLFNDDANIDGIIVVVDIGAGTSDMSMYRVHQSEGGGPAIAYEAPHAARGIEQAGNYLDRLLRGYVLKEAEIAIDHPKYRSTVGRIDLAIRDNKEALFTEGSVFIPISEEDGVTVTLEDFCNTTQVKLFSAALQECMQDMMEEVPEDWIMVADVKGAVRVVCTGGGASLPMVQALGKGTMTAQGRRFLRTARDNFPSWLVEKHELLRGEFPRTAVALGGARKRLISEKGLANVLAGGVRGTPQLEGYYTRGT
jgi:hypothetical protein